MNTMSKTVSAVLLGVCLLITSPLMTAYVIHSSPEVDVQPTSEPAAESEAVTEETTEAPTEPPTEQGTEPLQFTEK